MSTMSEPLPSKPMGISIALNAALSLVIVSLLSTTQPQNLNLGLCDGEPIVVNAADIAQADKARHAAPAEVELPGNVMRKTFVTTDASSPTVSYIRCRKG